MQQAVIDANALAAWLAKDAAEVWWTVDGEINLEAQLDLPCTGSDLATAVRTHGGELVVFFSEHGSADASVRDPGALAVRLACSATVRQRPRPSDQTVHRAPRHRSE